MNAPLRRVPEDFVRSYPIRNWLPREYDGVEPQCVYSKSRLPQASISQGQDGYVTCTGGGIFLVVGTISRFEGHLASFLFGRLPSVIHIDGGSDDAFVFRSNFYRFSADMRGSAIGRSLFSSHLAFMMLLQVFRLYLSSSSNDENWLTALSSPRLAMSLDAMQTVVIDRKAHSAQRSQKP